MLKYKIIPKQIKKYLKYNPNTGLFNWIIKINPRANKTSFKGSKLTASGYFEIIFKNKRYQAHRVAWFLYYNMQPKKELDHINGNKTDNSIKNLREVTKRENQLNRKEHRLGKLPGTTLIKRNNIVKWQAQITINKKYKYLGIFKSELEAHNAYLKFINELKKC